MVSDFKKNILKHNVLIKHDLKTYFETEGKGFWPFRPGNEVYILGDPRNIGGRGDINGSPKKK